MATTIKDIIQNTKDIFMTDSSLEILMDFERIIDELDVYAFDNWKHGELVEGPIIEKYFVTCTFMWPYKLKPDTRGAKRLAEYDCVIKYKKETLKYPVKVKTPDDFEAGTKMPKMGSAPVWLVTITVPKSLMDDIRQGSVEVESEVVDTEDIDQSYDENLDQDMNAENDEIGEEPEL